MNEVRANKVPKACDVCRARKVKCLVDTSGTCTRCQKANIPCTFKYAQSKANSVGRLPSVRELVRDPNRSRLDELAHMMDFRREVWRLNANAGRVATDFLVMAGLDNNYVSYPQLMSLLHEPTMPEVLPVVLAAMEHHLLPTDQTMHSASQAISQVVSRDARLLINSISLLQSKNDPLKYRHL